MKTKKSIPSFEAAVMKAARIASFTVYALFLLPLLLAARAASWLFLALASSALLFVYSEEAGRRIEDMCDIFAYKSIPEELAEMRDAVKGVLLL